MADEFIIAAIRRWIKVKQYADRFSQDWNQKLWEALRIIHHQLFLATFQELVEIGRATTAEANKDNEPDEKTKQRIREIGQKLWDAGEIDMMRAVFYPVVNSVGPEFNSELESMWTGIGTWER